MAQDWLKIRVIDKNNIGKGTTVNIDLDNVGYVLKTFDDKGEEVLVFGGRLPILKSQLNELEWFRISRIVENLPEHKE